MSDEQESSDEGSPVRIHWRDTEAVKAWARRLEVSEAVLVEALKAVGPSMLAVRRLLKK